jgi:VanZ family protein
MQIVRSKLFAAVLHALSWFSLGDVVVAAFTHPEYTAMQYVALALLALLMVMGIGLSAAILIGALK